MEIQLCFQSKETGSVNQFIKTEGNVAGISIFSAQPNKLQRFFGSLKRTLNQKINI